jgi:hypothetical protein
MPKLTLLLGRKTMQVFDLEKASIIIGRDESEADVLIDNPSVSRRHTEIRQEGSGWVVEDLGSSNGTFLAGEKISGPQRLAIGDEIGLGKFSVVFGKEVGEAESTRMVPPAVPGVVGGAEGTMQIKSHEVKELLKDAERKRRAHIEWESGGQRGQHQLSEAPAALFGTSDLCDIRVPKAPKHHVIVIQRKAGCEVRNLHGWTKMKVGGGTRNRATLKDGDTAEIGGLKLTFVAEIG